jgi:hypothetical protein
MLLSHAQVDELQRQLTAMQKQQRRQQQHAPLTDPAQYHAVITGLRASMAQVGSMASSVSQENKLLAAENKRLAGLKEQQDEAIRQLQVGTGCRYGHWNPPLLRCPYRRAQDSHVPLLGEGYMVALGSASTPYSFQTALCCTARCVLQARIRQLEGNLLQQLAENSRDTLQQAEAAAVGAKLDAMLTPELLAAAAAAGQPPGSGSSLLLEEIAAGNNQVL